MRHLRKQFWGRHCYARDYLAVSSGTTTDERIQRYIKNKRASLCTMTVDFKSTPDLTPRFVSEGCLVAKALYLPPVNKFFHNRRYLIILEAVTFIIRDFTSVRMA